MESKNSQRETTAASVLQVLLKFTGFSRCFGRSLSEIHSGYLMKELFCDQARTS